METFGEAPWSSLGSGGLAGAWASGLGYPALWKLQRDIVQGEKHHVFVLYYFYGVVISFVANPSIIPNLNP